MLAGIMVLAVVFAPHSSPDAASLVDQLGASRYSARVAAEGDLAKLGRAALPALRVGRDSKDAEIRARSVALISRIENSLLLVSTPVGLDFKDVPLPEAIEAINRETGLGLSLMPEERPALASRRINLRSNEPLPFWKAIDALGLAGNVHPSPEDRPSAAVLDRSFLLQNGVGPISGPVSDSGPFRVRLSSVHAQSEIQLDDPRPFPDTRGERVDAGPDASRPMVARSNREFFLQFVAAAEPRLSITRNGAARMTTAIDDLGQSLLIPTSLGNIQQASGYLGMSAASIVRFRVDLNYSDTRARQIRTLRGVIPVIVAMRKPEPLVVPLASTKGQVFRNDEVAMTLIEHRPASKNQPASIQVMIRPLGVTVEPIDPGQGEPLGYRPDSLQQQVEILDVQGRTLSWFPSGTFYDGEESRLTLTVSNQGTLAIPVTLRYHAILKAKTEIGFEFRDVPIP